MILTSTGITKMSTNINELNPLSKFILQVIYLFSIVCGIIISVFLALCTAVLLVVAVFYNLIYFLISVIIDYSRKAIIMHPYMCVIAFGIFLYVLLGVL